MKKINLSSIVLVILLSSFAYATEVKIHEGLGPAPNSQYVNTERYKFRRDGEYVIGFSNVFTGNSWVIQLLEEAQWRADQLPEIQKYLVTNANFDANKQIADIEDMMAQGADAIIVNPVSPTAVVRVLEQAADRNIVVVIVAADANTDKATVRILADQIEFGRVGGQFLAEAMGGQGKVIGLRGIAGISVDTDRWNGAMEALNQYPDIEVVDTVYAQWSYDQARKACESLLLAHPDVNGVWSSGGAMTHACVEVFNEMGFDLVPMTGEANNGFFRIWVENDGKGTFDSIAPQNPTWMVAEGIAAAVGVLNGQKIYTNYQVIAKPISQAQRDQFYKPYLSDSYWVGSILPDAKLRKLYSK